MIANKEAAMDKQPDRKENPPRNEAFREGFQYGVVTCLFVLYFFVYPAIHGVEAILRQIH